MKALKVAVLASGRGSNLQSLLDRAREPGFPARVELVVSDRPGARALEKARNAGVEARFMDPDAYGDSHSYDQALAGLWEARGIGLVCLAGFMRLLGPGAVQRYDHRILNIHPSLLPAFPGLDAQAQALNYGVKVTGATVHLVDLGMDTGPIVLQEAVPVYDEDSVEGLSRRILEVEHRLYPRAVELFARDRLRVLGRKVYIGPGQGEI